MAAFDLTVSARPAREENEIQKPIFYISRVLKGDEVRYLNIEKVALALLLVVRKFKVYLKNQQGVMVTDQPQENIAVTRNLRTGVNLAN